MQNRIEEYRRLSAENEKTDYSSKRSVHCHNKNVKKMGKIVEGIGIEEMQGFSSLLDEPCCARWLAHQLVERHSLPEAIESRCIATIEALSLGDGAAALGERVWLDEWRRRGRPR
jgi:hypothetical protein